MDKIIHLNTLRRNLNSFLGTLEKQVLELELEQEGDDGDEHHGYS